MQSFCKRSLDVTLASIGLLLALPLVLIAGILVKLTSPGPVIFSQTRIGKHQVPFTCYKLRTMVEGTEELETYQVPQSAMTPVGRILRTSKLDELPQLWNVIIGQMSLVGPRPCLPSQIELIEERSKRGVYNLAPGITGVAQIQRITMAEPVRLAKKDAEYIELQDLMTDLRIIVKTANGKGIWRH